MATTVEQETAAASTTTTTQAALTEAQIVALQDVSFLTALHPEFVTRAAAWARDEARLAGGDHVLRELTPWKAETAGSYAARRAQAKYLNFPQIQALILSGHLERARPMPGKGFSLGPLGDIQDVDARAGRQPNLGEMFWYSADGVGNGSAQFPKVAAATQKRSCADGHMWTLVEMPSLADIREMSGRAWYPGAKPDAQDEADGFHPYLVTWSPRMVPYWKTVRGKLACAIVRVPVESDEMDDVTGYSMGAGKLGYYLLVADGYGGFGDYFAKGGWWLFDDEQELVITDGEPMMGGWAETDGEIPMFALVAGEADAALDLPRVGGILGGANALQDAFTLYQSLYAVQFGNSAQLGSLAMFEQGQIMPMSRGLTVELGQVAINLMNRLSERDANFSAACKSILYILGVLPTEEGKDGFNLTVQMAEDGSVIVPVTSSQDQDGKWHNPTTWHSSAGLVDAQAAQVIIDSCLAEAREIMVRMVTADAGQSGKSKQVEFTSGSSPLLTHMLLGRATWEGNVVYYVCRRAGKTKEEAWQAFSKWPREVELRPVIDDIDAMFLTLLRAGASSATLAVDLIEQSRTERALGKAEHAAIYEKELTESLAPVAMPTANTPQLDANGQPVPDANGQPVMMTAGGSSGGASAEQKKIAQDLGQITRDNRAANLLPKEAQL